MRAKWEPLEEETGLTGLLTTGDPSTASSHFFLSGLWHSPANALQQMGKRGNGGPAQKQGHWHFRGNQLQTYLISATAKHRQHLRIPPQISLPNIGRAENGRQLILGANLWHSAFLKARRTCLLYISMVSNISHFMLCFVLFCFCFRGQTQSCSNCSGDTLRTTLMLGVEARPVLCKAKAPVLEICSCHFKISV